jgi:hypothetical protein
MRARARTNRFLLSNGMLMTSFFTNYRGAPFMEGLFENKALLIMLGGTQCVTFLAASGQSPDLNEVSGLPALPCPALPAAVCVSSTLSRIASLARTRS